MVEPTYVCRVCRSKDENLKKCTRCKSAWFCEKEVCRGQFPDHTTSELCKKSIHDNPEVLTGHRINVMRYTSYMFKDRIMDAVVERKSVPDNPSIEVVLCTLNSGEQDMCESYRTSRLLTSLSEGNLSPKIQQSLKKSLISHLLIFEPLSVVGTR